MKTSIVGLLLTLATATALAQQPSRTYSNIVINVVTSTNAVTFIDLQGHAYSNVTVKLIPCGLGWHATDGTEGRLAITNLDDVTLADITGLSTNQVEYLRYKKAMEDAADIPQEATDSTPWWLAPYPGRTNWRFRVKPEAYPTMYNPMMNDLNGWPNDGRGLKDSPKWQDLQDRVMRGFPPGTPVPVKPTNPNRP